MVFRASNLQIAFEVPGDHAFRIWGYGTADRLEDVLAPGYMRGATSLLGVGDLIFLRTEPRFRPPVIATPSRARGKQSSLNCRARKGD